MDAVVQSILSGAPILVLHLVTTLAVLALGVSIYMWVTPYEDIRLVRAGNAAGAVALGGAMLGFAIPLGACLAGSVTTLDILLWGCVTVVIQIAAFRGVDLILKDLGRRIETGEMSAAIFLVFVKLSVAVIVAAGVHR
jgi:putative membrane protein